MIVGIVKESFPGERRVALVPSSVTTLTKLACEVVVEPASGIEAGFSDAAYAAAGARVAADRAEVDQASHVVASE